MRKNCGNCKNRDSALDKGVCMACTDEDSWMSELEDIVEGEELFFHIKGVDKNTEIVEAEKGCIGKQSPTCYKFDLIDSKAIFTLAEILKTGAEKYGENNWRGIATRNHINKALIHLWAYLDGDTQDDHLGHAFCRLMMALAKKLE